MNDKEIIIFGAGRNGERFIYQHFRDIRISCFWDNIKKGEILGYQIRKPEEGRNVYIIVAATAYLEIRVQLLKMGYQEFDDFIPYQLYQKKIAVAYGNCHMGAVKMYLERHKGFSSVYGFYPFPMIQVWKDSCEDFETVLRHCNLFLHQSVRKDNGYGEQYSSEYLLQFIPKTCEVISIPNLYGLPQYLFPQIERVKWELAGKWAPFFVDGNMVRWIREGKSVCEIKNYITGGGVYQKRAIVEMWDMFVDKTNDREKEWNIKILDYILQNQREQKVFSDINHITSMTALEIANRILDYMGYLDRLVCELAIMDNLESIVYADVVDALELCFDHKYIRRWGIYNAIYPCEMSEETYIEQMYQYIIFWLQKDTGNRRY